MNILEELWFGNISPWERPFKKDSAYAELLALVIRHQEDLNRRLNDEEKEIFEKYSECSTEMHDLTEREAFVASICDVFVSNKTIDIFATVFPHAFQQVLDKVCYDFYHRHF